MSRGATLLVNYIDFSCQFELINCLSTDNLDLTVPDYMYSVIKINVTKKGRGPGEALPNLEISYTLGMTKYVLPNNIIQIMYFSCIHSYLGSTGYH